MQMASSAKRTCKLWRSASEYTATVLIPRSLQAQITRTAISPRLAIRIFWNILARTNGEQGLSVLYWPSVFHELGDNGSGNFRFDFVHELHGFDNAKVLANFDLVAYFHERRIAGLGRIVICSYYRRLLYTIAGSGRRCGLRPF